MLTLENKGSPILFDFAGNELRQTKLTPYCDAILKAHSVPAQRLYVYIADSEDPDFTNPNSLVYQAKYFRGFQSSQEDMHHLPTYLQEHLFLPEETISKTTPPTFLEQLAVDHVIYIRNSTSINVVAFVLTLAHELQHVIQYCNCRKILSANALLLRNLAITIDPTTTLTMIDIPYERDANIVSKRIAEIVLGVDAVNAYVESQIVHFTDLARFGERDAQSEAVRWKFLQQYDSSFPYDLHSQTIELFEQYKGRISPNLAKSFDLDIKKREWWF